MEHLKRKNTWDTPAIIALLVCASVLVGAWLMHVVSDVREPSLLDAILAVSVAYGAYVGLPLVYVWLVGWQKRYWDMPESWMAMMRDVGLLYVMSLPLVIWAATQPAVQSFYAIPTGPVLHAVVFLVLAPAAYFIAEEYLFRGFFLFSLREKVGARTAVLISSVVFAFFHIQKPALEIPIALIFGAVAALLALRHRSFVPAALLHLLLGISVNVLVFFFAPGDGGPGRVLFVRAHDTISTYETDTLFTTGSSCALRAGDSGIVVRSREFTS